MSSRKFEKIMLMILTSVIMSLVCWTIVDNFIVNVSILEYICIEFLLLFAFKSYTFVSLRISRIEE